jgi:hypothetical protein
MGNGALGGSQGLSSKEIKVHMGLCVETCLVREMMSGAGSAGMWS